VLVCSSLRLQNLVIDAIARAAKSGPLAHSRLREAAGRVSALQQRFVKAASAVDPSKAAAACGTAEAREFAALLSAGPALAAHAQHDPTERGATT
jgi:hypothetical protein